ncbi:MAG: hypothetical protein AAF806_20915, partial [Bacteroidota bacterium]
FSNIPVMNSFLVTPNWQQTQSRADSLRRIYLASIDLNLLVEWSRRYREEQDAKRTPRYAVIVQSNYDRIKVLVDSLGFPSERFVGLDNPRIAPNRINNLSGLENCNAANSKIMGTLLHYDNPITDLGFDRCVEAIKKGLLHPRQFASIYTFERYEVSRINDKINIPDLPDYHFGFSFEEGEQDEDRINWDRALFGIGALETDIQKEFIARKYGLRLSFGYKGL